MARPVCDPREPKLLRGDKHAAVRIVQDALNRRGSRLAVDGDFGGHTERVVKKFQHDMERVQGATAGVVGLSTLNALGITRPVRDMLVKAPPKHVEGNDWHGKLGFSRVSLGGMSVDPNTRRPVPAIGTGWVLSGHESLVGGRITNSDQVWHFHDAEDPDRTTIRNNECALLAQAFGCGGTRYWRRGPHVRSLAHLPRGTVIATLRDGVYWNDHSGRSHVGIFDGFLPKKKGFRMYDQSNGANIALRDYAFYDSYDPDEVVEKKTKSNHGDLTIPVYDDAHRLLGYTVIEHDYYKSHKFKRIGIGDEYYVMYSTTEPNLVML
ncbi:MAG: hypothetical protein B7Z40_21215 [Bosea sp. 12-68-7]|nr:MAG: hypothetical protein B7Z40_21215 [Bosea sp. 12-68-7]